jgi:hypothetical protein
VYIRIYVCRSSFCWPKFVAVEIIDEIRMMEKSVTLEIKCVILKQFSLLVHKICNPKHSFPLLSMEICSHIKGKSCICRSVEETRIHPVPEFCNCTSTSARINIILHSPERNGYVCLNFLQLYITLDGRGAFLFACGCSLESNNW